MFGARRGGLLPQRHQGLHDLAASAERVNAQGIMWMAARWGGAFTPLLVALVLTIHVVAARFRAVRRNRRDLGGLLLPLVPGQSPRYKSVNAAELRADRSETSTWRPVTATCLGAVPPVAHGLAALGPVFLPVLRLVLLHYLASHLSSGGAGCEFGNRRPALDTAAVSGRMRIVPDRVPVSGVESLDGRRG